MKVVLFVDNNDVLNEFCEKILIPPYNRYHVKCVPSLSFSDNSYYFLINPKENELVIGNSISDLAPYCETPPYLIPIKPNFKEKILFELELPSCE